MTVPDVVFVPELRHRNGCWQPLAAGFERVGDADEWLKLWKRQFRETARHLETRVVGRLEPAGDGRGAT